MLGCAARPAGEQCLGPALAASERPDPQPHRHDGDDHQQRHHDQPGVATGGGSGHPVQQPAALLEQPAQHPHGEARPGVPVDLLGELVAGQLGCLVAAQVDGDPEDHPLPEVWLAGVTPAARASSRSSASRRIRRST